MKADKWIWMPHAAHLIVGDQCKFRLGTWVGKYIVSTVGEYWSDSEVRKIHAKVRDAKWFAENEHLIGDNWDHAFLKKFGYMEIGAYRKYETMVFKAKKYTGDGCCPYIMVSGSDVDFQGYNDAKSARAGHMKMCLKWSKK